MESCLRWYTVTRRCLCKCLSAVDTYQMNYAMIIPSQILDTLVRETSRDCLIITVNFGISLSITNE